MRARTKIVCTLGPATNDYHTILSLIDAGMNVARINMSHGEYDQYENMIDMLKRAREERQVSLAIMLDTKGPEVRVGVLEKDLVLQTGDILHIKKNPKNTEITIDPFFIIQSIAVGDQILFDDGYITSTVVDICKDGLTVKIENSGTLGSHKGVNIPHTDLMLPAVTKKDIADIIFGCEQGIDLLAASFIRSAEHIKVIKDLLKQHEGGNILVIAKIENALGVKNFDSIVQVSDGIMVARGDLGVELPLTQVPGLQKMMIRNCFEAFKPVITATQMLESMISNPRPTRAEISDVANAVYDGSSAVMLSGETAIGKYPIEAVEIMRNTIIEAEKGFDYIQFFRADCSNRYLNDVSSSLALAAVKTAYSAHGKAIVALTTSGFMARLIERFRPHMPIIALTPNSNTYHQLSLSWGVVPVLKDVKNMEEGIAYVKEYACCEDLLSYGDLIVITAGNPFGVTGTTNAMLVDNIGPVLVRGLPSVGARISAPVTFLVGIDHVDCSLIKNHFVVIATCSEKYFSVLKSSKGIILNNHPEDIQALESATHIATEYDIPLLVRADSSFKNLKEGQVVTMDPAKGLIFDGDLKTLKQ